jgi:hypothetical protein
VDGGRLRGARGGGVDGRGAEAAAVGGVAGADQVVDASSASSSG